MGKPAPLPVCFCRRRCIRSHSRGPRAARHSGPPTSVACARHRRRCARLRPHILAAHSTRVRRLAVTACRSVTRRRRWSTNPIGRQLGGGAVRKSDRQVFAGALSAARHAARKASNRRRSRAQFVTSLVVHFVTLFRYARPGAFVSRISSWPISRQPGTPRATVNVARNFRSRS